MEAWRSCYIKTAKTRISVATWNANSLRMNSDILEHFHDDILAVQEVRCAEHHAQGLALRLRAQGKELLLGRCPGWRKGHKSWMVDRQTPGVAFVVKDSIIQRPVKDMPATLQHWYDAGRLLMWEFLIDHSWIRCTNIYMPTDAEHRQQMSKAIIEYMKERQNYPEIVLGDINADTQQSYLVHATTEIGWRNMASESSTPFVTYTCASHESALDTIMMSPMLALDADHLRIQEVPKGHKMVKTTLRSTDTDESETKYHAPPALEWRKDATAELFDKNLLEDFKEACDNGSLDRAWQLWNQLAACLSSTQQSGRRGGLPTFRTTTLSQQRHEDSLFRLRWEAASPEARAGLISEWEQTQKRHKARRLADWKRQMKNSVAHDGRAFYSWLRGPRQLPRCTMTDGEHQYVTKMQCLHHLEHYWNSITGRRPPFVKVKCTFLDQDEPDDEVEATRLIKGIVRAVKETSSMGLDGWRAQEWRTMPNCMITLLVLLYQGCRRYRLVPEAWLPLRMACIPKTQDHCPRAADFRPISVASLAYRCLAKWQLASLPLEAYHHFPAQCIGGLPEREAPMAWYTTALEYEEDILSAHEEGRALYGIAIDTYKFFDHITLSDACLMLANLHIPVATIEMWRYWAENHRRHFSYAGLCSPQGHSILRGIPQGCPLSMIAANGVMAHWIASLTPTTVCTRSYVDDRLLAARQLEDLQQAVWETQKFDNKHGMYTKAKTKVWCSKKISLELKWLEDDVIPQGNVTYLGLPLLFRNWSAESWYGPIIKRIRETAHRMTWAEVVGERADGVVACKLIPMFCHATVILRPSKAQYTALRSIFRKLTWQGRPWAAWPLIQVLIKSMKQDPQAASVVYAWTTFQRHLQRGDPAVAERWLKSWKVVEEYQARPRDQKAPSTTSIRT